MADVNGDGQMDVNEFSIACKLITSKLKGSELPQTLPPQMMPVMPGMMPGMMPQPGMRMNAAGKRFFNFLTISHCLKITEKVSFYIASEASNVYISIKMPKIVNLASF